MDIKLIWTPDGFDLEFVGGVMGLSSGITEAVIMSWFGGNEDDSGDPQDAPLTWWGNLDEDEEIARQVSRTQHLLRSLPYNTANRLLLEEAMRADLAWMVPLIATEVTTEARLRGAKRVQLLASITIDGRVIPVDVEREWE